MYSFKKPTNLIEMYFLKHNKVVFASIFWHGPKTAVYCSHSLRQSATKCCAKMLHHRASKCNRYARLIIKARRQTCVLCMCLRGPWYFSLTPSPPPPGTLNQYQRLWEGQSDEYPRLLSCFTTFQGPGKTPEHDSCTFAKLQSSCNRRLFTCCRNALTCRPSPD